ncbi:ribonuclease domain-containing protein [Corynebacterium heidelbergense]|uniref:Ribonuclease n=1 Tax=Corynebacterium heidelbergense TaxID=2055947 RepID=A0A364VAE1_9CORY|nr:ribonuclease domain-containing protein [Corynebacterium heidelbergense]RAV33581.1 ribonuclease [Corynebacterium heidelbergense]WCZ36275.1 Guanyl-specific ribonuclease Sa [Corynebacterium heidelbergense]
MSQRDRRPRPSAPSRRTSVALAAAVLAAAAGLGYQAFNGDGEHSSPSSSGAKSASETCTLNSLPPEAAKQARDILTGAPPDDGEADGKHFGNYEHLLPEKPGNYYREYTVKTPGKKSRGERRIVVGGGSKTDPDVWYYSPDHYQSFCTIPDAEQRS